MWDFHFKDGERIVQEIHIPYVHTYNYVLELSCIVIRETESGIQSIHSECIFATCVSCMYDVVTKLKASSISRVQREAVRQK